MRIPVWSVFLLGLVLAGPALAQNSDRLPRILAPSGSATPNSSIAF
jgi:hypothetical protein